jgi:uncharacterized membrane protein YgcG
MESSLMSDHDMATLAAAPGSQDVRKRWLLLAAALVVGLVAAFAIGSAVKKTSASTPPASLAPSSAASAQHPTITPLTNGGAVPALHAPPSTHKVKPKSTPTNTSPASSGNSSVASTSASSSPTQSSAPTQSSTPTQSSGGGAGSSGSGSSSGTGGSQGGGGGGGGAG